jgi:hypothetical protein
LVFISCGQNTGVRRIHTASDPKYKVTPRLIDTVTTYYYTVSSSVKSRYEVDDKKKESTGMSELGLVFRLAKDSTGAIAVRIIYDKLHVVMENDDEKQDITASKSDTVTDPIGRMFGNILGSEIHLILDTAGNIHQVNGTKELTQKILSAMNGADPAVRTAVETQLDRLAGEAFVRSTLQQMFKLVPDSIQYVGDSWIRTQESDGLKLTITTKYTFKDVKDHLASIVGHSDIKDEDGTPILFMGQSFPAALEGEQKSNFQVEMTSGLVLKGLADLSLKGTIQVMGKEVSIRIDSRKTIEGKKL